VGTVSNIGVRSARETDTNFVVFFDPPSSNLTYSGIYRFLNNPERVLGLAGVWGVAFITWNAPIFYLAATAHILNLAFLQFVERPHMTT
jgi:phosphatidylethanolamine N-methyltransferase